MTKESEQLRDVPTQVFSDFLQALTAASVSNETVERLRTALLEDEDFSELGLQQAVLGEEPLE